MATLNISDKQKQRVVENVSKLSIQLGTQLSQATVVDMAMAVLEEKYNLLTIQFKHK